MILEWHSLIYNMKSKALPVTDSFLNLIPEPPVHDLVSCPAHVHLPAKTVW